MIMKDVEVSGARHLSRGPSGALFMIDDGVNILWRIG